MTTRAYLSRSAPTDPTRGRTPGGRERGIAILSVITVLTALLLIAIPFVISMKLGRDRTQASAARNRAAFEAELVGRAVVSYLKRTHPGVEQAARAAGGASVFADDTVDSLEEIEPPASYRKTLADLISAPAGRLADPRGSIWSWEVRDANALVNPNGAKAELLGNLLGAASLSEDLDAGASSFTVKDVMPTPAMGLAAFRENGGYVRVGNEVIAYQAFRNGTFEGCSRGVLRDAPLKDNGPAAEHKRDARVVDYVAYKLATHLIAAAPGTLSPFGALEAVRKVQEWGGGGVLEADRYEALARHLTVWSRRETSESFLEGQTVLNPLPSAAVGGGGEQLTLRSPTFLAGHTAYFNPNTVVRISDGTNMDHTTVLRRGDERGAQADVMLTTAGPLPEGRSYEGGEARVQALAPYPINLNTASRVVLAAVFAGLRVRNVTAERDVVSAALAWDLADRLVKSRDGDLVVAGEAADRKSGPFRHNKDLLSWLDELLAANVLTQRQVMAIARNAVNPNDGELEFGTAHFCYRTLDVYHVESRVVVNDVAGAKEAEAALRQAVEVGADAKAAWVLDSQADFEVGLALGAGGKYFESYPFNVGYVSDRVPRVQPRPRAQQMVERKIYPSTLRALDVGDVRLQASRIVFQNNPVLVDHFDGSYYADGHWTPAAGAFSKPVKQVLRRDVTDDPYVHPFTVAFWMRPFSDGNWFAFDTGKQTDQNRVSIYVRDGDQGKELVLRVCDTTLEEKAAEIVCPLARLGYQPQTWYHIQANVRGADATQMELLVDGISVGRRVGVTYLTSGISADQDYLPVEHTDGFDLEGAVVIGTEVVEYDQRSPDGFTGIVRGARGTRGGEWPKGTTVKRLGYAHPLTLELRRGGTALEQRLWERWAYVQVTQTSPEDQVGVSINGVSLQFYGVAEDTTQYSCVASNPDPSSSTDPMRLADAFQSKGFAVLAVRDFDPTPPGQAGGGGAGGGGASGPQIGGWEVVYYTRQGLNFDLERYQSTANHTSSGQRYFAATRVMTPNGEMAWPAYLIPISVLGVGVGRVGIDYIDPMSQLDRQKLEKYAYDGGGGGNDIYHRPRCAVGDAEGRTEVFTYDSIDRQKAAPAILFVRDHDPDLTALSRVLRYNDTATTAADLGVPAQPAGGGAPAPPVAWGSVLPGAGRPRAPAPSAALASLAPAASVPRVDPPVGPVAPIPIDEPVPVPVRPVPTPSEGGGGSDEGGAPTQGGIGPGEGRDPPTDNSGGGGAEPRPGTGPGGNQPEPGQRPAADPPQEDTVGGGGGGNNQPTVPSTSSLKAVFSFRGVLGTTDLTHPANAPVQDTLILPCFRILRLHDGTGLPVGGPHAGFNDVVTLVTGKEAPQREQHRVRWSHGVPGGSSSSWVALRDFVEGSTYEVDVDADGTLYKADNRGFTRLVKFPSGEMPDEHGENVVFGRNDVGGGSVVTAFFDEVHMWRHQNATPLGIVVNNEPVLEEEKEIVLRALPPATTLVGVEGHDRDCGVVDVGGELIVYRGTRSDGPDTLTLERCRRGALGTKARAHPPGTPARFVPDLYVSYLQGTVNREASTLPLAHTRRWPREGAARIVGDDRVELVHYTGVSEGEGLLMPEAMDADPSVKGRGLLRGRFGTEAAQHQNDDLVVFHPFRYWDRAMPRRSSRTGSFEGLHDHPEASYVEFAKTVRDAYWIGVGWTEQLEGRVPVEGRDARSSARGRDTTKADIVCLVRFDQGLRWDSTRIVDLREGRGMPPEARADPRRWLYVLDRPGTDLPDQVNALGVEASTAEFRFVFLYLRDAYRSQEASGVEPEELVFENEWKNSPWLRSFTAKYANRTKILSQAEIR